ncbi:MAG: hypothetical protein AAF772_00650 [Acidobacteriota bacterium]
MSSSESDMSPVDWTLIAVTILIVLPVGLLLGWLLRGRRDAAETAELEARWQGRWVRAVRQRDEARAALDDAGIVVDASQDDATGEMPSVDPAEDAAAVNAGAENAAAGSAAAEDAAAQDAPSSDAARDGEAADPTDDAPHHDAGDDDAAASDGSTEDDPPEDAVDDRAVAASDPPIGVESSDETRAEEAQPRPPDDLRRIRGIGPALARRLRQHGITHFHQIAAWTDADIDRFAEQMRAFPDRIRRDDWVGQAARLRDAQRPDGA